MNFDFTLDITSNTKDYLLSGKSDLENSKYLKCLGSYVNSMGISKDPPLAECYFDIGTWYIGTDGGTTISAGALVQPLFKGHKDSPPSNGLPEWGLVVSSDDKFVQDVGLSLTEVEECKTFLLTLHNLLGIKKQHTYLFLGALGCVRFID